MKHQKRVVAIVIVVLVLLGIGAFLWKLIGPTSGVVPEYRTFSTYEELATDYANPVIEAYSKCDEAQEHTVEYATLRLQSEGRLGDVSTVYVVLDSPEKVDREYTSEEISLDRTGSAIGMAPTKMYYYPRNDMLAQSDDTWFRNANEFGIRSDYAVDGVTVQKFYERDYEILVAQQQLERYPDDPEYQEDLKSVQSFDDYEYWERVAINNEWYYVRGFDEATVDSVATALAQIAKQL